MKNVLVTGAGGYIGTCLVDILLEAGYRVVATDLFWFGEELIGEARTNANFHVSRKDIRDLTVDDFRNVDVVCDLAAISNDPAGDLDEALTYSINYQGRVHVARCARDANVARYILASSCSVYGKGELELLSETTPLNPLTNYAKANALAEEGVLSLCDEEFSVTALRFATLYGLSRRMRFDLVVNTMTLNAIKDGEIQVRGGGQQWRPLLHVRDAARAFLTVLEAERASVCGQVFNAGSSSENYQIKDIANIIRDTLPNRPKIKSIADATDQRTYNVSFEKIERTLGYRNIHTPREAALEIWQALDTGIIDSGDRTQTVVWIKNMLSEQQIRADGVLKQATV